MEGEEGKDQEDLEKDVGVGCVEVLNRSKA